MKRTIRRRRTPRVTKQLVRRTIFSMAEKKYFDGSIGFPGPTLPGYTWTYTSFIAGITQGTAANNRIGDKIIVHAIHMTLQIHPVNIPVGGTVCRYAVVHNKQANGALAAGNQGVFDTDGILANRYVPLLHRYSVLHDATHTMVKNSGGMGPPVVRQISVYPKKRVEFSSNVGTVSDLATDDYGWFICADDEAGCCQYYLRYKVIFSDA